MTPRFWPGVVTVLLCAPALAQEPAQGPKAPDLKSGEKRPAVRPDDPEATRALEARSGERPPPPIPGAAEAGPDAPPLHLDEVLEAVERAYPLLQAAELERVVTEGQLLSAQGAFDLNFRARESVIVGSFDSHRLDLGLDQPTPFHGVTVFGGYRLGAGSFPVYYGDRKTAEGGEFRAGAVIPLLRDREIDRRRATVQQAGITRAIAEPNIQVQRLDFLRAGGRAYWNWVAAGRRYEVAYDVLDIVERRDPILAKRVKAGDLPEIDRIDNQRAIQDRRNRLVAAVRALQQASINLSLYYRDPAGNPVIPPASRLPRFPEPAEPNPECLGEDIALALRLRPELHRFALQRERTGVELRLAENQLLPGVGVALSGGQDVGQAKRDLDRYTYEAALVVDVPLQRRDARGRVQAAQGTIGQLTAQERFARDRITAEVRDAYSALTLAVKLVRQSRENARAAREVERRELRAFDLGQSNLLNLNIRELTRAEAELLEVEALAEYYRSLIDYFAALGLGRPCPPEKQP